MEEERGRTDLILPSTSFLASLARTSFLSSLATLRAPYSALHPSLPIHSRASASTSSAMRLSARRRPISASRRSTMPAIEAGVSLLKTSRLSSRLMSSGGKKRETAARIEACASGVGRPEASVEPGEERASEPRLDVRQRIVFLKSTVVMKSQLESAKSSCSRGTDLVDRTSR